MSIESEPPAPTWLMAALVGGKSIDRRCHIASEENKALCSGKPLTPGSKAVAAIATPCGRCAQRFQKRANEAALAAAEKEREALALASREKNGTLHAMKGGIHVLTYYAPGGETVMAKVHRLSEKSAMEALAIFVAAENKKCGIK